MRTRHAPATSVVLRLWWTHGNIAVAVAHVDAALVADELFGQYCISKKETACICTYYALLCFTGTYKASVRKFSVRSVSQVNILQ